MSDDGKIILGIENASLISRVLFPLNGDIFLQMEKSCIMEYHFVALLYNMVLYRVFEFIRLLLFYDLKVTEFYVHSE